MFLPDLVLRSRHVVLNDAVRAASLHIRRGTIIGVLDFDNVPEGCPLDDAGGSVVMAGLVDTLVHVGPSASADAFRAATRAAAAGGVTTIVDAGDGEITSVRALQQRRQAADGNAFVNVGFWANVIAPNTAESRPHELPALVAEGVFGVAECLPLSEADLRTALAAIAKLGVPLVVHAEVPDPAVDQASSREGDAGNASVVRRLVSGLGRARASRRYESYLSSRPKDIENGAVALLIRLCREHRARTHIAHLSSSDALAPIFHARAERLPITTETCPHYLSFVAEEIPDGAVEFKCAPPIRGRENRELLWAALKGGLIQMVVSDHSAVAAPGTHVDRRRNRDFVRASAGIASLELSLAATWTAALARQCSVRELTSWMCRAPARLAGLERKGTLEPGYDADLVVWDPDQEFTVDPAALQKPHATPYAGRRLRGIVERTYVSGVRVYERGGPMRTPRGQLIARPLQATRASA